MLTAIYEGILLGFVLAISFGPAFFALINTGISHGFKSGFFLAVGVIVSDVFLITVTLSLIMLGLSQSLNDPKSQSFIGVIGGIVLIMYGAFNFVTKPAKSSDGKAIAAPNNFRLIVKGFFLNLFNPFVWIFWLATTTAVSSKFDFSTITIIIFFSCTLGVVFSTDLLKAFIAGKIKKFLTAKLMQIVNYISGVVLIAFGLYLIYKVFFMH